SASHYFKFNVTPCSILNKSIWHATLTWIPKTVETQFDIKGNRIMFPKGHYAVVLRAFSDASEQNIIMCLNFTMIVKQDAF
ncbi:hypothetical protein ASZ78_012926, partial [Callipepla squamata]